MAEETKTTKKEVTKKAPAKKAQTGKATTRRGPGGPRRGGRKPFVKTPQEFDQKIIDIRRVTRVVAGGRRFSFSVACVIGDKKGRVGVGIGKAGDTSLAIQKAARDAKKRLIKVALTEKHSIPHEVEAKFNASKVIIKPTKGQALIAGSSVRNVLELLGVKGANAKVLSRSKNKLNNARAAVKALKQL
ncbi:30S ribosomal protein S5 [bacterium]|nr:30S ribosomal protein S5 [bacterium]|tara:strand:+ start:13444 stop:14007 length:564 start_codon:yes stop_codon:yes gene_type:complete